jgi:hypothetical protein
MNGECVCARARVCVCVCVGEGQSVSVPSSHPPSRGGVTSSSQTPSVVGEEAPFQNT